eukprot:3876794-Rhodomonas_salina.3
MPLAEPERSVQVMDERSSRKRSPHTKICLWTATRAISSTTSGKGPEWALAAEIRVQAGPDGSNANIAKSAISAATRPRPIVTCLTWSPACEYVEGVCGGGMEGCEGISKATVEMDLETSPRERVSRPTKSWSAEIGGQGRQEARRGRASAWSEGRKRADRLPELRNQGVLRQNTTRDARIAP